VGGKAAVKEKVGTREGRGHSSPAPPVAGRGTPAPARPGVMSAGREGANPGGRGRVRPRPRVARVRPPSPEQRLAAAFRRMYRGTVAYFRESRLEMRKVVWPSRRETLVYTLVVVMSTAVVGLVIWVFDVGLSTLLRMVIR